MFRRLVDKATELGFRAALKRGLVCPACGTRPDAEGMQPSKMLRCAHCGTSASLTEWIVRPGLTVAADPDHPPAGTKITRSNGPSGEVVWSIPASGRSGGLMFFGIFWCAITGAVSAGFLAAFLQGQMKDTPGLGQLGMAAFFILFWAVGIGMLYGACRNRYARHRLTAGAGAVVLRRELFGRVSEKSLPAAGITSIDQVVFYQQNYQPVHGIEIKGPTGKLRFGSVLGAEEKAWLVADLRRVVQGAHHPERSAVHAGSTAVARQAHFSVVVPKSGIFFQGAWVFLLMGLAFLAVGAFVIRPASGVAGEEAPRIVRVIDSGFHLAESGFRVMWLGMSGLMASIGAAGLVVRFRGRDQETRVDGNDGEITLRVMQHGRVVREKWRIDRSAASDVRCFTSGSSNGREMKRVELVTRDKVVPLVRWCEADAANAFAGELRSALFGRGAEVPHGGS